MCDLPGNPAFTFGVFDILELFCNLLFTRILFVPSLLSPLEILLLKFFKETKALQWLTNAFSWKMCLDSLLIVRVVINNQHT